MLAAANPALQVDHDHPALPGHFPGTPVVPGVVLLSSVLEELRRQQPQLVVTGIKKLKFLKILFPGQSFTVEFGAPHINNAVDSRVDNGVGNLRFKCWQDGAVLAEGNLSIQTGAVQAERSL